jgi:hypothetical protein|tara:strand:+ start:602 stop:1054 length:453 start_codon:yes stop_codon:yes gene_type:complete
MPEKIVKIITTDDSGKRHTNWETKIVDENLIEILLSPLGIITLPLGKVFVNDKRGMPKHKLYNGDIVKTGSKSRVEIKIPSGGEVGEKWIVRIGEQSEFVITSANLKEAARNYGIAQYKDGNLYDTFETAFTDKPIGKKRLPTAVAAIYG